MSSARGAAVHVGRIGTLAVALGISAAVAGGTGAAWADGTADAAGRDRTSNAAEQTGAGPSADAAAGATESSTPARRSTRGPRAAATAPNRPPADGPAAGTARRSSVSLPAAGLPLSVAAADPRTAGDSPVPDSAPPATAPKVVAPQATVRVAEPAAPQVAAVLAPILPAAAKLATPAPMAALVSVPVLATPLVAPVAAVAEAAPVTQTVVAPPRTLMSRLLSAMGLSSLGAGSAPGAPVADPALWALMAWTRRESTRTLVRSAASASTLPAAAVTSSAVTTLPTTRVGWVTGPSATPSTAIPGPGGFGINGTDLGIMWFNGENGLTQLAFGDTFSGPNMTGAWRSNVLLLSDDTTLYNGLTLIQTGYANQFIPAARNQVFFIGSEVTNIPTSAIYVPPNAGNANGENYVNYMSVKSWDSPGRWTTNYSAVSQYDPTSDKWVLQKSTIRSAGWFRSSTRYRAGDQNFQQMAYVLQPEEKVGADGIRYVYAFGTPSGRQGSAYLSRVPENAITDLKQYEYWDGSTWVRDRPAVATEVIGTSRSSGLFGFVKDLANNPRFFGGWFAGLFGPKTGGNVSEMSVQYNEYLDKYVVMYGDGLNNIQLRTADTPEGPWSDPIQVASSFQYPGLYAPMIHPLSGTGQLTDANGDPDNNNLYWNLSLWGPYNVVLMKTDLTPLNPVLV